MGQTALRTAFMAYFYAPVRKKKSAKIVIQGATALLAKLAYQGSIVQPVVSQVMYGM